MHKATNIVWHAGLVSREDRTRVSRARPAVVWLTGLSGCGKSTIAVALERALLAAGHMAYVLDGDNVRHGLNRNLGFSPEDRTENIRRIGEVAKLFADAGVIAIASFISPYRADRAAVRALLQPGEFVEVFVDAPVSVCEERDPKGLYKKARAAVAAGKGLMFTGIDAPYEAPETPELHLHTDSQSPEACVDAIVAHLKKSGRIVATGEGAGGAT
jgi:adenylylsulfate kinase